MFTLEKLNTSHLQLLQEIGRSTYLDTFAWGNTPENMEDYLNTAFATNKLLAELEESQSEFYFAKEQEQIVGYIKINFGAAQTELRETNGMELERIYVSKAYQGKKIGQFLLDTAISIASNKEMEYIWLGVWEKNTKAITFYKKNKFVCISTHSFFMGADEQTDWIMKRLL
jgi:diamine N-acetyltransferase